MSQIRFSPYSRCDFVSPLDCRGILLQNVGVPSYAVQGKDAVLTCDYDLEGQALYSVKWYKNGLEFFRYLPGSAQKMTVYARPGFFVVQEQSDAHQVTLKDLTMKSTGRYRCEVSTEAPSFATVSNYGDMVVVGKISFSFRFSGS